MQKTVCRRVSDPAVAHPEIYRVGLLRLSQNLSGTQNEVRVPPGL